MVGGPWELARHLREKGADGGVGDTEAKACEEVLEPAHRGLDLVGIVGARRQQLVCRVCERRRDTCREQLRSLVEMGVPLLLEPQHQARWIEVGEGRRGSTLRLIPGDDRPGGPPLEAELRPFAGVLVDGVAKTRSEAVDNVAHLWRKNVAGGGWEHSHSDRRSNG